MRPSWFKTEEDRGQRTPVCHSTGREDRSLPLQAVSRGQRGRSFLEKTLSDITGFLKDAIFTSEWVTQKGLLQCIEPKSKLIDILFFILTVSIVKEISILFSFSVFSVILAAASSIGIIPFVRRVWLFIPFFAGLIFPDTGEVSAFGERLSQESLKGGFNRLFRSRVAFLFQNPDAQLFSASVRDEIAFGPLQLELPQDEIILRVEDTMKLLRIGHLQERSPHELSIGEKRKVAIASLLTINPDILLLDEPTAGLDPRSTRELINLLTEANEAGKTIITATHDLHIVPEIANRCYVFSEEKRVAAEGKTENILSNMTLLKECNLIHIHSHKHNEAWHSHPHGH